MPKFIEIKNDVIETLDLKYFFGLITDDNGK